jgi:putative PIN family toxin of toxin-antitoxin system
LQHAILRSFRCYVSPALLEEYNEVLPRARLKLDQQQISRLLKELRRTAVVVTPRIRVRSASDADDNKVIECALAGRADFIVTGNIRHFPVRFQDIRVVTPSNFQVVLASTPSKS